MEDVRMRYGAVGTLWEGDTLPPGEWRLRSPDPFLMPVHFML